MKPNAILLFSGFSLLLQACTTTNGSSPETKTIAEARMAPVPIPDRPSRIAEFGAPEEFDQLLDAYDKSRLKLKKNKDNYEAWLRMAEVFITNARVTGDYGTNHHAALDILDNLDVAAKEERGIREQVLALKATIKLSQHQFAEALELGKQAVELNPVQAYNWGILVDANVELGHYDEAVKASDRMVGIRPDLRSYSRISYLREIHGDVPGAIEAMELAVKAGYPGFEETEWCRTQLGKLYEGRGDLKAAEELYTTAISERKNYAPAMAALGRIETKKMNWSKAEEWLGKAIAVMPDAAFYLEQARVFGAENKTDERKEAVENTRAALKGLAAANGIHAATADSSSHGHSHEVGVERARLQLEFDNDLMGAEVNGLREQAMRPDNNEVNALLASLYYAMNDMGSASTSLAKAQRTGSTDAMLQCLAGLLAVKKGDATAGKALIRASFELDPYQMHLFAEEARKFL